MKSASQPDAPFWLSDAQWAAVSAHLPTNRPGPRRVSDRAVISGIVYMLTSGHPWRDCPPVYGPYMTVFNRYNRWKRREIWTRIAAALNACGVDLSANDSAAPARRSRPARSGIETNLPDRVAAQAAHPAAPIIPCKRSVKTCALCRRPNGEGAADRCLAPGSHSSRECHARLELQTLLGEAQDRPQESLISALLAWHIGARRAPDRQPGGARRARPEAPGGFTDSRTEMAVWLASLIDLNLKLAIALQSLNSKVSQLQRSAAAR